jgi:hypothetical protein
MRNKKEKKKRRLLLEATGMCHSMIFIEKANDILANSFMNLDF